MQNQALSLVPLFPHHWEPYYLSIWLLKLPVSFYCSVHSSTILWSADHFNSSRMFKISPSCVSNDKSADAHVLPILLLLELWEAFYADSTLQKNYTLKTSIFQDMQCWKIAIYVIIFLNMFLFVASWNGFAISKKHLNMNFEHFRNHIRSLFSSRANKIGV